MLLYQNANYYIILYGSTFSLVQRKKIGKIIQ